MTEARSFIFTIADKRGRPTMRTTRQRQAEFMVRQGWTVIDVIEDHSAAPSPNRRAAVAAVALADNRDLVSGALRLGSL